MDNETLRESLSKQILEFNRIGFEISGRIGHELVVQNSFRGFLIRNYEDSFRVTHSSAQLFLRAKFSCAVSAYKSLPESLKLFTDYSSFISEFMSNP